jgi:hypothetical protein
MKNIITSKSMYGRPLEEINDLIDQYKNGTAAIQMGIDEINQGPGSSATSYKLMLDSTVYSTVLWTILATCLIYYVFIKL